MDGDRGRCRGFRRAMAGAAIVAVGIGLTAAIPAATHAQQTASDPTPLVFEGVTVVDVEQGQLVPNQRVVIVGNRIQAVESLGAGQIPKGAKIVEARGKYLMPGLWDMHVHYAAGGYPFSEDGTDPLYPLLIANGITGIRDGHSPVPLETMVQWRQEILAGTRVGPPRQLLTGSEAEIHVNRTNDLTEREVRSLKERGANFIKLYPFTPAAAAVVKRVGLPFGGHLMALDPASLLTGHPSNVNSSAFEASDSGMSILDHVVAAGQLDSLCWGGRKSASVDGCRRLVEHMLKNGTWLVPTLLVYADKNAPPEAMGPVSLPIASRFRERFREFLAGSLLHGNWLRDSTQVAVPAQRQALTADSLGFMRIMRQVGMPILAGTDARQDPWNALVGGFSLHAELAMLVAEGLSPLEVLRSATLNPAKLLHGTDSLGTVTPGKLADLVLLDADPLADITNTTTIRGVVANGRYFDRPALDQLLADVRPTLGQAASAPDSDSDSEP